MRRKLSLLFSIVPVVLILDFWSKSWALRELQGQAPQELLGGLIPLTFALNTGAAFGLSIGGGDSRWFFVPVTIIALGLLAVLFKQADKADGLRLVSLSFVVAGAVGNLWDRVRWSRGVVDFIGPVDLGFWDFPIFNVADIAISCGAVLLAISFWQEERALAASANSPEAESSDPGNPSDDPADANPVSSPAP